MAAKTTSKASPKTNSKGKTRGRPRKESAEAPARKSREPRSWNRPIAAVVFLVLSVAAILSMFPSKNDVFLLDGLRRLHRGMVGTGWWLCGFAYLGAAIQLCFHHGKPVRLRVGGILSIPLFYGVMVHSMMGPKADAMSLSQFAVLYNQGGWEFSGGMLGGTLAQLMLRGCGRFFSFLISLLMLIGVAMILLRTTPVKVFNDLESYLDGKRENRGFVQLLMEQGFFGGYDPEGEPAGNQRGSVPEPAVTEEQQPAVDASYRQEEQPTPPQSIMQSSLFRKKRKAQDIPLDGYIAEEEEEVREPYVDDVSEEDPQIGLFARKRKPKAKPAKKNAPAPIEPVEEETVDIPSEPLMKKEKFVADAKIQHELVNAASAEVTEYQPPSLSRLRRMEGTSGTNASRELKETQDLLMETIRSFGINGRIVDATRGPSVTRYEFELERGVKLSKITGLSRDFALSLGVLSVRIAPIPGKLSVVGIEVPNRSVSPVSIRSVLESGEFQSSKSALSFAVGKDISNRSVVGDISRMPHLLIAGTTGSGKSVCTNSMIISLLYKSSPKDVRLIMVDPKMVELSNYNGIPHLLIPVVTDPKKAAGALQWAVFEMLQRYQDFANHSVREIESYNALMRANPELGEPKPKIVIFIDELADLMIAAAKEVEESICRVAQMGRAAGMHLVIATQRPSSDVITGLMKANIPSRIALAVASSLDSRIILDTSGAEDLVGNGDMLFAPLGKQKRRVQGCFISDEEVNDVINEIKRTSGTAQYSDEVSQMVEENARRNEKGNKGASAFNVSTPDNYGSTNMDDEHDPLFYDAVDIVVELQMASASTLQRKLKVGYSRAGRLIDEMEEFGYVGPFEGSKPRKVLISKEKWSEKKLQLGGGGSVNQDLELARMMSEAAEEDDEPPFDL